MAAPTRPEWRRRLVSLAQDQNVSLEDLPPRFSGVAPHQQNTTADDVRIADTLIAGEEASKSHSRPFFRTKKNKAAYNYKIATAVLCRLVESNGSPAIVHILLDRGNIETIKRKECGEQISQRDRLLAIAVGKDSLGLTQVLARLADQSSKDAALATALFKRNAAIVQTLLENGAAAQACSKQFCLASSSGDLLIVELLLRAAIRMPQKVLKDALENAVRFGSLEIVTLLAKSRTLDSPRDAHILERAIKDGNCGILLTLLLHDTSLPPSQLDSLVSTAYECSSVSMTSKVQMIEGLLCAGASGNKTDEILAKCVVNNTTSLIDLLVRHKASVDWDKAQAVKYAVSSANLKLVSTLLSDNHLTPENAELCVRSLPLQLALDLRNQLLQILITAGASGPALDEELVRAIYEKHTSTITLLLQHGASPNRRDGAALVAAIITEQVLVLRQLLNIGIEPRIFQLIFATLRQASKLPRRLMTQQLIGAGAIGDIVDQALRDAVCDESEDRDDILIQTLVGAGASGSWNGAASLKHAISSGRVTLLGDLLSGPTRPSLAQVAALVQPAMRVRDRAIRSQMMGHLFAAGVEGPELNQVLCDVVSQSSPDLVLLELLVSRSRVDANFQKGKAILKAATMCDIGVLKTVTRIPEISEGSWSSALRETLRLPFSEDQDRSSRVHYLLQNTDREKLATRGLRWHLEDYVSEQIPPADWRLGTLAVLLKAGADVNDDAGWPLVTVTSIAALPTLALLLKQSPKTSTLDIAQKEALKVPDRGACLEISKMLLPAGVSPGMVNNALLEATARKDYPLCDLLLQFNASPSSNNGGAITTAAKNGSVEILRRLLQAGIPTQIQPVLDKSLLAAVSSSSFDICDLLFYYGASPAYQDGEAILMATAKYNATMLEKFLTACPAPNSLQGANAALVCAAKNGSSRLCTILLQHEVSLDFNEHEAIKSAVAGENLDILKLMLANHPSHDALRAAFQASRQLQQRSQYDIMEAILRADFRDKIVDAYLATLTEESSPDKALIGLLLAHDASVHYHLSQCMKTATIMLHLDLLKSFFEKSKERAAATQCLSEAAQAGLVESENTDLFRILLENGATREIIDQILVDAVVSTKLQDTEFPLVDLLLSYEADVNHEDGEALFQACGCGPPILISKLLQYSPDKRAKSRAFAHLLKSGMSEEDLLQSIDSFTASPGPVVDYYYKDKQGHSILQLALGNRPSSDEVLERILYGGCPVEQAGTPILFWALQRGAPVISSSCLNILMHHGAQVNHQDKQSGNTILMLAVRNERADVVTELIAHGADVSVSNDEGESVAVLAVKSGIVTIVSELQDANAVRDDGSLHIAACNLNLDVVEELLRRGHNPNHPSALHQGRSVLGELCLNVQATLATQCKVEKVIESLLFNKYYEQNKADIKIKEFGKPLLCLALDNKSSQPIVGALMKYLWRMINEDFNIYEYCGYYYSPAMYLSKGLSPAPQNEWSTLRNLLGNQARDVFYAREGPQPADAKGMPDHIRRADEKRKEKEEQQQEADRDYQRQMQRERDAEANAQTILQQRHALQLEMRREKAREEEAEALKSKRMTEHERESELEHQRRAANQQTSALQARNKAELEHAGEMAVGQQRALEARYATEYGRMRQADQYSERYHERAMKQLQMQSAVQSMIAYGSDTAHTPQGISGPQLQRFIDIT